MDDSEKRENLYQQTRNDLLTRQIGNSQNYDSSILTLSTAALGFSLAFLTDAVEGSEPSHSCLLVLSWIAFGLAIVVTVTSFQVSQIAIERQLELAERYYRKREDDALAKRNPFAEAVRAMSYVAGVSFLVGLFLSVLFISANF